MSGFENISFGYGKTLNEFIHHIEPSYFDFIEIIFSCVHQKNIPYNQITTTVNPSTYRHTEKSAQAIPLKKGEELFKIPAGIVEVNEFLTSL